MNQRVAILSVMAGLDPAIVTGGVARRSSGSRRDGRVKPGHDGRNCVWR
jgi:hypothetical protein